MSLRPMKGMNRYSRQIVLDRIGKKGQERLGSSSATVVGLGALGTVIADLFARAGVGHLRLIDRDVVELVNLQRQILYEEEDVGLPKAMRAAERLRRVNSSIEIEGLAKDVSHANVLEMIGGSDLVMDGTDNLETRFLLNEACLEKGIPWVYGGAIGTEGRAMAIAPKKTACFRCFTRGPPPPGLLPTCETAGILNSVASATASIQVTEGVKLLLGQEPSGHLLVLDGWTQELLRVRIDRSGKCPVCVGGQREFLRGGKRQVITALCGQNTISLDPLRKGEVDLPALARRLRKIGKVKMVESIVFLDLGKHQLTVFQDGRALIKGTESPEVARSLYSKYVGL